MTFSDALIKLKEGYKLKRYNWNGKGMWIFLCKEYTTYDTALLGLSNRKLPFIILKTSDECLVPWLASQTDILADDWEIIHN